MKVVHRTLRNKMYRYFTYKNTYRFVDVLPQLVKAYNYTVHSSIGMAPSAVTDGHVLEIWTRMDRKRSRARMGRVRFRVGQHVRISKEKIKFAKGSEKNYTEEIFKINKVINWTPRPVYELEDMNGTSIEVQFYGEELKSVRVTRRTSYKIDKILDKRRRNGILEYLLRWKGHRKDFDPWVHAARVKKI